MTAFTLGLRILYIGKLPNAKLHIHCQNTEIVFFFHSDVNFGDNEFLNNSRSSLGLGRGVFVFGGGGGYMVMNMNMTFTLVGVHPDSLFCLHGKSLCKVCGSLSCRNRFHSMK